MTDSKSRKLPKGLNREILLSFWKVHILAHACEKPVYGLWMLEELRHHGYVLSPGTLYPIFHRMVKLGWLEPVEVDAIGSNPRNLYAITQAGREILRIVRHQLEELEREMPDKP